MTDDEDRMPDMTDDEDRMIALATAASVQGSLEALVQVLDQLTRTLTACAAELARYNPPPT